MVANCQTEKPVLNLGVHDCCHGLAYTVAALVCSILHKLFIIRAEKEDNNEFEKRWKEEEEENLKYYPDIFLEGLGKPTMSSS
jgi:hypothetical protein